MTGDTARPWLWGPYSGLALAVAGLAAVIDQGHKWWMILGFHIADKGRVAILPFLDLVYTLNRGISYSLFEMNGQIGQLLLAGFALAASVALWVWIARGATGTLMAVSLALIMGGAIGNGLDRVTLGGVADFFLAHAYGYTWYVFNLADAAIVAGVAGLLYESFVVSRKDATKAL
ncbi:MAG: signal peptidase II [Gammaproteobacteria bacterium]